jgi:hypothetical protein
MQSFQRKIGTSYNFWVLVHFQKSFQAFKALSAFKVLSYFIALYFSPWRFYFISWRFIFPA